MGETLVLPPPLSSEAIEAMISEQIDAAVSELGSSGREIASAESTAQQAGITGTVDITGLVIPSFDRTTRNLMVELFIAMYIGAGTQPSNIVSAICDAADVVKGQSSTYVVSGGQQFAIAREKIVAPGNYSRKARTTRSGSAGGSITLNGAGNPNIVARLRVVEL